MEPMKMGHLRIKPSNRAWCPQTKAVLFSQPVSCFEPIPYASHGQEMPRLSRLVFNLAP